MNNKDTPYRSTEALRVPDIRLFIGAVGSFTLASRSLAVVIAFQIYQITHSALALGWLGLIEAIPAIALAPFGGYIADHFNRRKVLLITRAVSVICALFLAYISSRAHHQALPGLYAAILLTGVARGFADPASSAFEAQVVPKHVTVNASSWIGSTWICASVAGPAAIGFIFEARGAAGSYLTIAVFFLISWILTVFIRPKYPSVIQEERAVFKSILTGWKALWKIQPLVAAMALDLFAVFFGGAIILLPVYANDILHVGAKGLGLLNAAASFGALTMMLAATRRPPIINAGKNLLLSVAGFGVSIIVFAFSRNFFLSLVALFFSGVFDGVSMVIRRSMLRLLSPDHLRGRIAAAGSIFIVSSNELGAFESGMVAAWIGTVPSVAAGGFVTLLIVALTARFSPQLTSLRFNKYTMNRE
ncbi:MAG: MFS transporter [Candidatus Omnitrophica bacterium]|nr:MFS transporter [Candidatus Omnitrophota bacterium]